MRLFLAFTDGMDGAGSTTLERIAAASSAPPTVEQRARLAEAAVAIHSRAGWRGLTVPAVAGASGLPAQTVIRIARGRCGLAGAVWSSNVPTLWRAARALARHVDGREALRCFAEQVADMAQANPEVSRAFLNDVWAYTMRHGAPRGAVDDPRVPVPLPAMFEHLLTAHAASFRPGLAEPGRRASVAAALVNLTLLTCLTHPHAPVGTIAELVLSSAVDGLLASGAPDAGDAGPGDEPS